jgi:hypothetical protein
MLPIMRTVFTSGHVSAMPSFRLAGPVVCVGAVVGQNAVTACWPSGGRGLPRPGQSGSASASSTR